MSPARAVSLAGVWEITERPHFSARRLQGSLRFETSFGILFKPVSSQGVKQLRIRHSASRANREIVGWLTLKASVFLSEAVGV